jgi:hypothetical protein
MDTWCRVQSSGVRVEGRAGLVLKVHTLSYHPILGARVIKKKKRRLRVVCRGGTVWSDVMWTAERASDAQPHDLLRAFTVT